MRFSSSYLSSFVSAENYDLPDDEKYDKIPEIWDGHNIADFVDTDILAVRFTRMSLYIFVLVQKLEVLREEERLREAAGVYDDEITEMTPEMRLLRSQAAEIRLD